jgi:hypothetical protein
MPPGKIVHVHYEILAEGSGDVGIGMGLYDEGGTDRSTGFGDLDPFTLQDGRNPDGCLRFLAVCRLGITSWPQRFGRFTELARRERK